MENLAFIILCPDLNIGGLRLTVSSIKVNYPDSAFLCILGDNARRDDIKEFSRFCPTYQGGKTITSLINKGMRNANRQWCFTIVAGNFVRKNLLRKYQYFCKNDKDIFYSVVDKSTWLFEDATINGIMMNKKVMKDVGDFPNCNSITESKLYWSMNAREKGYSIKGIVGVKI